MKHVVDWNLWSALRFFWVHSIYLGIINIKTLKRSTIIKICKGIYRPSWEIKLQSVDVLLIEPLITGLVLEQTNWDAWLTRSKDLNRLSCLKCSFIMKKNPGKSFVIHSNEIRWKHCDKIEKSEYARLGEEYNRLSGKLTMYRNGLTCPNM